MHQFLAPLESETVEKYGKHLEVIVLLVAHHVNHLVDGEILESHLGCTDILGHIHGGAVGAQKQFLVKTFIGQVCPYTVVLMTLEETLGETFLNLSLALEISLRLIVNLVEAHTESFVCLVESGIHPVVHLLP